VVHLAHRAALRLDLVLAFCADLDLVSPACRNSVTPAAITDLTLRKGKSGIWKAA